MKTEKELQALGFKPASSEEKRKRLQRMFRKVCNCANCRIRYEASK